MVIIYSAGKCSVLHINGGVTGSEEESIKSESEQMRWLTDG